MTPEGKARLRNLLVKHESYRQYPYTDTTGHISVAIGRNLSDRGISVDEALVLLNDDMDYFYGKLCHFLPWFNVLDENRQVALCDMAFNLGVQGFLNFHDMLAALEAKDFQKAHDDMLASKWAEQVKDRATDLANIILTGQL